MTDPRPLPSRFGPPRLSLWASLAGVACVALCAALSACGASTALGNAVLAPLSTLSATDVVLETNLQTAIQGGLSAGLTTTGTPSAPGVVSVGSAAGVAVYTAFNPVDRHCLGTFVLSPGAAYEVLGETVPGTYDFWFGPTTAVKCTAATFTTESTVPAGWAKGDPSMGWPSP